MKSFYPVDDGKGVPATVEPKIPFTPPSSSSHFAPCPFTNLFSFATHSPSSPNQPSPGLSQVPVLAHY